MRGKLLLIILLSGFNVYLLTGQTIRQPNYGIKSHETLVIESVVMTSQSTILNMVIENRSLDGTFCADRNVFIILPGGKRLRLSKSEGIPRCPDKYVFKSFGERLYFTLHFPPIPEGTEWIDLVEDCDEACFSFYPVILDPVLNQQIDHAFSLIGSGELTEASTLFENLLSELEGKECHYEGAIYLNLIYLARKTGDKDKVSEWEERLRNSNVSLKEQYLEHL